MKRRLSVAISAMGDPKIIFMDEPTTGMDPVNRRATWDMIEKMKPGRAIVYVKTNTFVDYYYKFIINCPNKKSFLLGLSRNLP